MGYLELAMYDEEKKKLNGASWDEQQQTGDSNIPTTITFQLKLHGIYDAQWWIIHTANRRLTCLIHIVAHEPQNTWCVLVQLW
jgi:hypothetical protein